MHRMRRILLKTETHGLQFAEGLMLDVLLNTSNLRYERLLDQKGSCADRLFKYINQRIGDCCGNIKKASSITNHNSCSGEQSLPVYYRRRTLRYRTPA